MASELVIVPTAYRHGISEDQIRHALANVVDVFENEATSHSPSSPDSLTRTQS